MNSPDLKKIVLTEMHSILKPAGFKKSASLFSAEQDDVILFIQLQSSVKTTKDLIVATVNLGIFSKAIADAVRNTHQPNIHEAHWQKRIGSFLPKQYDKWWEISSAQDAIHAAKEITDLLSDAVLPEMQHLGSLQSLQSLWENGLSPGITEYQRDQYLQALDSRVDC